MKKVQDEAPGFDAEQRGWLSENLEQQRKRHSQIVADMEVLSGQREEWINEFLDRIQRLGFNYNCDAKRAIPADEIPAKPDRPFKVVF